MRQPPLLASPPVTLTVAIAGLALGGAERIVLEWARRVQPPWTPQLVVLRDHPHEWPVPSSLIVTRLHGVDVLPQLRTIGHAIAKSTVPVCVCHLLTASERDAIGAGGAFVVPVIHNAEPGWLEPATTLDDAPHVIAVSEASAQDIRRSSRAAAVSVIRHIPTPRSFAPGARERFRAAWRIPPDAAVIGMIGAVKPQKDYPFAVRLLRALLDRQDVYLVILGGPTGKHGREAWHAILADVERSCVRHRLAMPGFVSDAAACLPAFDLLLNTSDYEGLSVATLEALVNGLPVVASRVGGQGETHADGLTLVAKEAPPDIWTDKVMRALRSRPAPPSSNGQSTHRLWTLAHLARPFHPSGGLGAEVPAKTAVLFVTANLNAGGAQRSLVNLVSALHPLSKQAWSPPSGGPEVRLKPDATVLKAPVAEVALTGDSTAEYFFDSLRSAGVPCARTAASRDAFDHAERLVYKICTDRVAIVCFWNLDPKIKLLVTKALAFTEVTIVDVSPGPGSFDEMREALDFSRLIAFSEDMFYRRLDRLVLKYHGPAPAACASKTVIIPNGVAAPARAKPSYDVPARGARVVVNGRIAPTKFIVEIVEAMRLVRARVPTAELHVFGSAEPRHAEYAETVRTTIGDAMNAWVFFHGAGARTIDALADFDAFAVLGQDQASPNALLEALAAGLPCIANDDGGTREQIQHEHTGLLIDDRSPASLAAAITRVLVDRGLAARIGAAGRAHVLRSFSLERMVSCYTQLFESCVASAATREKTA